jgi:hypothetical protein
LLHVFVIELRDMQQDAAKVAVGLLMPGLMKAKVIIDSG